MIMNQESSRFSKFKNINSKFKINTLQINFGDALNGGAVGLKPKLIQLNIAYFFNFDFEF